MMRRPLLRALALALIFFFVGVTAAAAVFYYIPDSGSAPAVFDDFAWSSTANGFWHVNAVGATARIKDSILTVNGDSIELDRRVQTDPKATVVVAKVRGLRFHKFGLGIGVYHAGTIGMEFDDDGAKCGRGSDQGWRVDYLKGWTEPPVGQWFYLRMDVINPYPNPKTWTNIPEDKLKPITVTCYLYDSTGRLLSKVTPHVPPPNGHYNALDEVFLRTWDSDNTYQVDWFYAGPPSGIPAQAHFQA